MLINAVREMKYISNRFLINFITKLYMDSNVFDYLFDGMEQDDDSIWEILANNKSGSGSYVFKVTPDGNVESYDSSGKELRLTIPVKL